MRILFIRDICDIGAILVREAARKNIKASFVHYAGSPYEIKQYMDFFLLCIKNNLLNFNIYHFNYPYTTLLPKNRDIIFLKSLGKKVFLHYHGDDIRNKKEKENLKNVDGKIISTPDLKQFLPDAEWIPFPYDVRSMKKREGWNDIPRIVHAPSDRERKGTIHILRAIKELKKKYALQFELIEGKSNEYVLRKMAYSDIVIDQIGPGWYGKVTLEALYSGAVSCFYVSPTLVGYIPIDFFVPITEKTLADRIAKVIEDEKLRTQLRTKGYEYLKKYHNSEQIMERLIKMYGE